MSITDSIHNKTFKLAALGMCAAISIVLIYIIHFPIFPVISFMEYDPGDIPIFLASFMFGPVAGLVLTVAASVIQGVTVSSAAGIVGITMHILATGSHVLVSGLIMRKSKTLPRLVTACAAGCAAMTVTMILWNLIITPFYMHVDVSTVVSLLPYIIAFNLIKAVSNTVVAAVIYTIVRSVFPKILKK